MAFADNQSGATRFHLNEGLSAAQTAAHYGVSKSVIIGWINRLKIGSKSAKGRMTNPNNFRHHNPPYGFINQDSKEEPEEDFAKNFETYILNPKILKDKVALAFQWMSTNLKNKYSLKECGK